MSEVVADLLQQDGPMLEFVRTAVAAEDIRKGVDLLRTRPNETSLIQGQIMTHQLWQRVTFHLEPQSSVRAALSVDGAVVSLRQGTYRLDRVRLVRPGSVLRAIVRDPEASELSLASLEIFGWEVLDAWLPEVEEALRRMESS